MTTAADDSAVQEAFEALLAGRPVPEQGADLAAFAEAVRSSASSPGRPNAALAELLGSGRLTDQPSSSPRTTGATGRPRASGVRIRRRIAMFFPALIARIVSAGAVARAATGAGLLLVAFTGAGTAGVLPDSLQHGFATVAEMLDIPAPDPQPPEETPVPGSDPVTDPDSSPAVGEGNGDAAAPAEAPAASPQSFAEWAAEGPAEGQSFGDWVGEGARQGWADGATISHWAQQKHLDWPVESTDTAVAPTEASHSGTTGTAPTTPDRTAGKPAAGNAGGHGDGGGKVNAGGGIGSGHGNR